MTLAALNVVRAAISDESTALRLAKLGLVFKLATIVRQTAAGPPPPLPPRGSEGDPGKGGELKPHIYAIYIFSIEICIFFFVFGNFCKHLYGSFLEVVLARRFLGKMIYLLFLHDLNIG